MNIRIPLDAAEFEPNIFGYIEQIAPERLDPDILTTQKGDPYFPTSSTSISQQMINDQAIKWQPAQKNCPNPNYSDDIDDLQSPVFCARSVGNALLVMNWFVPEAFSEVFQSRRVKPGCLYEFKAMVNGVILRLYIDSMVPFKDSQPIFAAPIHKSIFPCLYEKLLAKVYGSYQNVSPTLIDIVEIFSCYSRQVVPFYQHSEPELVEKFTGCFSKQDLIFFRTRNSVRLQTVGLDVNSYYLITRFVVVKGMRLVEFLQIEDKKWIGKFAKVRSFWLSADVEDQQINLSEEGKQNFISMKDLVGVSREFVILHNTIRTHKKWFHSLNPKNRFAFFIKTSQGLATDVMVNAFFGGKKCRSTVFVVEENQSLLLSSSFKQQKESNFIEASLMAKKSYLLFVNVEDLEGKPVDLVISTFSSQCEITLDEISVGLPPQQKCFLNLMQTIQPPKTIITPENPNNYICLKSLYRQLGMGFLTINLEDSFKGSIIINCDHEELNRLGISIINTRHPKLEYRAPFRSIIMFSLRGKFIEGDPFPPPAGVQVLMKTQNRTVFVWK